MKEFIMRGQTASGGIHTINFSGHKGDYGFKLVEFKLWSGADLHGANYECCASVTAGKVAIDPVLQDFSVEGLIGSASVADDANTNYPTNFNSVVNDTFIVTQDLLLMVNDTHSGPVNWQVKFMPVKLSSAEAALTNYRQFSIFDD